MKVRSCTSCNKSKLLSEFFKSKVQTGGYTTKCKKCIASENRIRYSKMSIEKRRNIHLKKNYGLTLKEYNFLLEQQNNKCAVCEKIEHKKKSPLYVDHCHKSGKIRGLLCKECNVGLGNFKDDITALRKAIKYLTKRR